MYINNIVYKIEHMSVDKYRILITIDFSARNLNQFAITKLHARKKERRDLNKEFLSNRIYHKAGCWTLKTIQKENCYPKKKSR